MNSISPLQIPEHPKIHILLATFNRAHLIGETLDSIINQTYMNWECIIVDDFSSDDTRSVIEGYIKRDSRFSFYPKTEKHKKGLSASRNYGMALAKEKGAGFIQFFDDDDIMHPQKLELKITPLIADPSLDLSICCYRKFNLPQMIEYDLRKADDKSCKIRTKNLLKGFFLNQINLNSPGPLWRAGILTKYRFNEELFYAEEREFYLRIFLNETLKYEPVDKILFWYRKHNQAITSNLYQDKNLKTKSEENFYNLFLNHILKHQKAPFFLLKAYFVSGLKGNKQNQVKRIRKYTLEKYGLKLNYMKLLLLSVHFYLWKKKY